MMNRKLLLGLLVFFAVIGICLMGDQPQAQAGHPVAYGCSGCWGYSAYACDGCYGYVAPVVVHRPLFWRHHLRHAWRSCYGCWGWSHCGCHGVVVDCCGYNPCYGCAGGIVVGKGGATIVTPAEPQPAEAESGDVQAPPPPEPAEADSAMLNVRVPEDARVVINDYKTTSMGEMRRYVSRGLEPGKEYEFEVRAEVVRDGQVQALTKTVRVRAQQSAQLDFDFSAPQVASVTP